MSSLFDTILDRHNLVDINISESTSAPIINIYENGKLYESIKTSNKEFSVDNIYIAKVEKIIKNLNYSFIDIGYSRSAFLPIIEKASYENFNNSDLKQGDKILVQIKKEAYSNKGPVLTRDIRIPGQLVMLMPYNNYIAISSRILDIKKINRLKGIGKDLSKNQFGIVFRKNSENASINEIKKELDQQIEIFNSFKDTFMNIKAPYCIYKNSISINDIIYEHVKLDKKINVNCNENIDIYEDFSRAYKNKINIQRRNDINETFVSNEKKNNVFVLDNGSNIVVNFCEALTVFDVNSNDTSNFSNKTFLEINLLAAEEVARLIRLYNISGIILIDFINMESTDMETLQALCIQLFKGDPVPIILHGFTHTGLMEITRKRTKG